MLTREDVLVYYKAIKKHEAAIKGNQVMFQEMSKECIHHSSVFSSTYNRNVRICQYLPKRTSDCCIRTCIESGIAQLEL